MPRGQTTDAAAPIGTRSVMVSGSVAGIKKQPDTARGITVSIVTLVHHIVGETDTPPTFWVRVEDETLLNGLTNDERVAINGVLGEREHSWNHPVVATGIERFAVGAPMELLNDVVVVGKRVSIEPQTLKTSSLYDLELDLGGGSIIIVKVYKDLFAKLDKTTDGQVLAIKSELSTFTYHKEDVTTVRATSIEVVS